MRSDSLELRLQLRSTVNQTLNGIMIQNQISATDMEEAVEHFLLLLREQVLVEYAETALNEKTELQEQLEKLKQNDLEEENIEEE